MVLSACAGEPGRVATWVERAAAETGVPADLMFAVAVEEDGLFLASERPVDPEEHVPIAGVFQLRRGKLDTLALGARLAGVSEETLRADTALATRAGALVLAELGAGPDPATWRPALEQLSGMRDPDAAAYATRVLEHLRAGGDFPAAGGEVVSITPHPTLPPPPPLATRRAETPEFPGAIWFETSCDGKCNRGRPDGDAAVNTIVIHDTEGGWNASVATLQFDPGKSVHYIIDADGSRTGQFLLERDTAWHCGNSFYNRRSISIEHVGRAADPAGYSPAMYAKSRELVASIRSRWNVPLDRVHIIGHYQVPDGTQISQSSPPCADALFSCEDDINYGGSSNHTDPGIYWQWCQYMSDLGSTCTCNDTLAKWSCTTDRTEAWRCAAGVVESAPCTAGCEPKAGSSDDLCKQVESPPDAGLPDAAPRPADAAPPAGFHGEVIGGCSVGGRASASSTLLLLLALTGCTRRWRRRADRR